MINRRLLTKPRRRRLQRDDDNPNTLNVQTLASSDNRNVNLMSWGEDDAASQEEIIAEFNECSPELKEPTVVLVSNDGLELEVPKWLACRSSAVLRAMFKVDTNNVWWKEASSGRVQFHEIDGLALKAVGEYIQTGQPTITPESAVSLLDASNTLLITPLYNTTLNWIQKQLCPPNALALFQVGRLYNYNSLKVDAWEMLGLYSFNEAFVGITSSVKSDDEVEAAPLENKEASEAWRGLDVGTLHALLKGRRTLTVCCENAVVNALILWQNASPDERAGALDNLLTDPDAVLLGHVDWSVIKEPVNKVRDSVLALFEHSRSFGPFGEEINGVGFDGGFSECVHCKSVSYLSYSVVQENNTIQYDIYCENCIHDKLALFTESFPFIPNTKKRASKNRKKSQNTIQYNISNSIDNRRYTWADNLTHHNESIQSLRECQLLNGTYTINSFVGLCSINSNNIQVYISPYFEITGNGKDDMGYFNIDGKAFGDCIVFDKVYQHSRMTVEVNTIQDSNTSLFGLWRYRTTVGDQRDQIERQKLGLYVMEWQSIEDQLIGEKDLSSSLVDMIKTQQYNTIELDDGSVLSLKVFGYNTIDHCPLGHELHPQHDDATEVGKTCIVCGIKHTKAQRTNTTEAKDNSELDSTTPQQSTLSSTLDDEKQPSSMPLPWIVCSDVKCGFTACGDCVNDTIKHNNIFPVIQSPLCVERHPLIPYNSMGEGNCNGCAKGLRGKEFKCQQCDVLYCTKCATSVKVFGTHRHEENETSVVGILYDDALYLTTTTQRNTTQLLLYRVRDKIIGHYFTGMSDAQNNTINHNTIQDNKIIQVLSINNEHEQDVVYCIPQGRTEKSHVENASSCCSTCSVWRQSLDESNAVDILVASIRDGAVELQSKAEAYIVDNYDLIQSNTIQDEDASSSQNNKTIKKDASVIEAIHDASIVVATRVTDRILRHRNADTRHQFIKEVADLLLKQTAKVKNTIQEQQYSTQSLCKLGELLGLCLSSLRLEMLWRKIEDDVKVTVLNGLTFALSNSADKNFTSIAARIVSSVVCVVSSDFLNDNWSGYNTVVVDALFAKSSNVKQIKLALKTLVHTPIQYNTTTQYDVFGRLMELLEHKDESVVLSVMSLFDERTRMQELKADQVDQIVLSIASRIPKAKSSSALKINALALFSTSLEIIGDANEPVCFSALALLKDKDSLVRSKAVEFWTGVGDRADLRNLVKDDLHNLAGNLIDLLDEYHNQIEHDQLMSERTDAIIALLCEIVYCIDRSLFPPKILDNFIMETICPTIFNQDENIWLRQILFGVFYPVLNLVLNSNKSGYGRVTDVEQIQQVVVEFNEERASSIIEPVSELEQMAEEDGLEEDRNLKFCDELALFLVQEWMDRFLFLELLNSTGLDKTSSTGSIKQNETIQYNMKKHKASGFALGRVFLWRKADDIGRTDNVSLNTSALEYLKHQLFRTIQNNTTHLTAAVRFVNSFSDSNEAKEIQIQFRTQLVEQIAQCISQYNTVHKKIHHDYFQALFDLCVDSAQKEQDPVNHILLNLIEQTTLMKENEIKYTTQLNILKSLVNGASTNSSNNKKSQQQYSSKLLDLAIHICSQSKQQTLIDDDVTHPHETQKNTIIELLKTKCIVYSVFLIYLMGRQNTLFIWTQKEKLLPLLLKWLPKTTISVFMENRASGFNTTKTNEENRAGSKLNLSVLSAQILSLCCVNTSVDWLKKDAGVLLNSVLCAIAKRDHYVLSDPALLYCVGDVLSVVPNLAYDHVDKVVGVMKYLGSEEYLQHCLRSGERNPESLRFHRDVIKRSILSCATSFILCHKSKSKDTHPFNPHLNWLFNLINSIITEQELQQAESVLSIPEDASVISEVTDTIQQQLNPTQQRRRRSTRQLSTLRHSRKISSVSVYSGPDDVVLMRGGSSADVVLCEMVVHVVRLVERHCGFQNEQDKNRLRQMKKNTMTMARFVEKYSTRENSRKPSRHSLFSDVLDEEFDLDNALEGANNSFFHPFQFRLRMT